MSAPTTSSKVSALLWLAGGKSNRVAAEAAGVSPTTVATWRRDPLFASELAEVTALYEEKPCDGDALVRRLDLAEQRLASASRARTVTVRVRPGTPPTQVAERVTRVVARAAVRHATARLKEAES